jgi:hypothetical protein
MGPAWQLCKCFFVVVCKLDLRYLSWFFFKAHLNSVFISDLWRQAVIKKYSVVNTIMKTMISTTWYCRWYYKLSSTCWKECLILRTKGHHTNINTHMDKHGATPRGGSTYSIELCHRKSDLKFASWVFERIGEDPYHLQMDPFISKPDFWFLHSELIITSNAFLKELLLSRLTSTSSTRGRMLTPVSCPLSFSREMSL